MREKETEEERGGEKEERGGDDIARRSTERASEENLERKEEEEEELNNNNNDDDDDDDDDAKNHVTLAMSSPIKIKRRFTQESLDEDWNDSSGDPFDGTSSGSSIAEKRSAECCEQRGGGGGGEGEEEGEEIFYRSFTRLQKKDLRKERSAMNDLKFISRVGLDDGEENDDWETTITTTTTTMKKKNLLEARSRSEKLDAVLLLDVDENETAEGAEEGEEDGKKKEKKKSRSLRGLVEMMVEKAKMHFGRNDSDTSAAMVSSIFLDDAMNLSVANASVQSNGVLIIPVSAKMCVL